MCVCEVIISICNRWESEEFKLQACIQSFLEAFLFLVFSVQTKPNKTLHLNASRSEEKKNSTLKYAFLI